MSKEAELISLSDLVAKIKSDLLAQIQPKNSLPLLYIDEIEVTAQVVAKREKGEGGNAGLSLSVLGIGAEAGVDTKTTIGREMTQSVTLKLSPLLNKEEYLEQLGDEDRAKVQTQAHAVARSSDDGTQYIE